MSVVTLKMQGANVPRSTIEALLRELDPSPLKKKYSRFVRYRFFCVKFNVKFTRQARNFSIEFNDIA